MPSQQIDKDRPTRVGRVGEKGRITLPVEVRRKYGIKEGDVVRFTETSEGILIAPQAVIAQHLLDQLHVVAGDVPLEEWIETGRALRTQLSKDLVDEHSDEPQRAQHAE